LFIVLRLRKVKSPPQAGQIALGGADAVAITWVPSVVSATFMARPRFSSFQKYNNESAKLAGQRPHQLGF
jgi:hypothetical protein